MPRKAIEKVGLLRPMSVRDVPEPVRKHFRLACMQADYKMQDVVVAVMRYLDTPEKVKSFME